MKISTRYQEVVLLSILLFLGAHVVSAQSRGKESLSHLKGVHVHVSVQGHAGEHALSQNSLKTSTELQLRKSSINVYADKNYTNQTASPTLYVSINGYERDDFLSFVINVQLNQNVYTTEDKEVRASTYFVGAMVGSISTKNTDRISDAVKKRVRIFINDWMAVH